MGGHHDLEERVLPARERGRVVAPEQRGEGLLLLPLRVLGRERLDAVDGEQELEVQGLLGPQRAVVVEDGDALGGWNEVRRADLVDPLHEVHDGLLGRSFVPRRQRVLGMGRGRREDQGAGKGGAQGTRCAGRLHGRVPPVVARAGPGRSGPGWMQTHERGATCRPRRGSSSPSPSPARSCRASGSAGTP